MKVGAPRALVTGATGFVGSHLVAHLLDDNWEVHVLARLSSAIDEEMASRVHVYREDGTGEATVAAVKAAAPSVCFHLASHVVGVHQFSDIRPLVEGNLLFGAHLADALSSLENPPLFLNAASFWQRVDGLRYRPAALYAATKEAFQDLLQFYANRKLLRVVNLVLGDTYGPGDRRTKLLNLLIRAACDGTTLQLTPGEQLLDLVHVDDVCIGFAKAASLFLSESAPFCESFSMLSGTARSVREVVDLMESIMGQPISVIWGARPYRCDEMFSSWETYPVLPGWAAEISLEQGMSALLASIGLLNVNTAGQPLARTKR